MGGMNSVRGRGACSGKRDPDSLVRGLRASGARPPAPLPSLLPTLLPSLKLRQLKKLRRAGP
ncbi:MAG: hypothetical protein ACKO96_08410 [Flammeovirgaceae bacterium]